MRLTNFGSYSYDEARDKLDFLTEFDREYVSGRLGVSKPEPRIYQIVEEDSGIPPDRLIFADDRPTTSPPPPAGAGARISSKPGKAGRGAWSPRAC